MKRPMTLTGFIISTVMIAVYAGFSLFTLTLMIDLFSMANQTTGLVTVLALCLVELAFAVVSLVLNAISIRAWNKSPELYKKAKGKIITATVFNFILIVLLIIGIAGTTEGVPVLNILIILALIASNVLAYVDLGMEKKRALKLEAEGGAGEEDENEPNDVEKKIEKLNTMKEQGLITDAEYEELKKSYINEKLNG